MIETFGRLQDIDMYTSAYFISDKENRVDDGIGRFIYLARNSGFCKSKITLLICINTANFITANSK